MNHAGGRRNQSREWVNIPVADNGEAIVAAMTEAGVEFLFFTSGSEIGFYQEAPRRVHLVRGHAHHVELGFLTNRQAALLHPEEHRPHPRVLQRLGLRPEADLGHA